MPVIYEFFRKDFNDDLINKISVLFCLNDSLFQLLHLQQLNVLVTVTTISMFLEGTTCFIFIPWFIHSSQRYMAPNGPPVLKMANLSRDDWAAVKIGIYHIHQLNFHAIPWITSHYEWMRTDIRSGKRLKWQQMSAGADWWRVFPFWLKQFKSLCLRIADLSVHWRWDKKSEKFCFSSQCETWCRG